MTDLVADGTTVTGVVATDADGNTIQINAGAVILATGGYLGNRDLQERFLKTRKLNVARGGESLCTGDGIAAAEAIGCGLDKTFGYCPCEYGGTNSKASRPAKQDKYDQNYAFKSATTAACSWTPRASASSTRACCATTHELRLGADAQELPVVRRGRPGLRRRHDHRGPVQLLHRPRRPGRRA